MGLQKKWKFLTADNHLIEELSKVLSINSVICKILIQRGYDSYEKCKKFFRPQINDLHDPWLMKDMLKAVKRILSAIENEEKILVYGDYDVDGTTSVASFFEFLKKIYRIEKIDYYIPHRYKEGYGISKQGIEFAFENDFSLVVSLDCGIKSVELIQIAKNKGIDFIICDHHLPDTKLPPAVAILNPKQPDCPYPYKDLCGCGVGFKFICAICDELKLPPSLAFEWLDLLATAIAADIVPMTGENRILAYFGLKKANSDPNIGIRALKKLSNVTSELQINNLVYMIAPRVNAAGRMDDAKKAVQLFISESEDDATFFAEQLHSDNSDRKEADKLITEEALLEIKNQTNFESRFSTVVYQPHWHKGVVGIVASRLVDHFYRPTIVLAKSGEIAAGSARSIPGFNLYEAIHACKDLLIGYGGHFAAAGMTIEIDKIDQFIEKFEEVVKQLIDPSILTPEIIIDATAEFKDLNFSTYRILSQMEPLGPDNLKPILYSTKVSDTGFTKIVKEQHIKFSLRQGDYTFNGIGFGLYEKFDILKQNKYIDIVYSLEENEWNGNKNLQLKIIDLKPSSI